MEWALTPAAIPQLFAVGGMLLLAAALLWLNFNHPANRAFALFLVFRGLSMVTATTWRELAQDLPSQTLFASIFPYFVIPIPFILLYFVSVYPKRVGWFGRSRAGGPVLAAAVAVLEALYLLDHAWWGTLGLNRFGRVDVASEGPLSALLGIMFLGFAVVAFVFAREYLHMPSSPRRRSLLVVCLGFLVNALFDATGSVLVIAVTGFWRPTLAVYLQFPALLLMIAAILQLARHAARSTDPEVKESVRRFLAVLPLPVVSNFALFFPVTSSLYLLTLGLWRLAFPAFVTYALVRHQLFDIDLKIKWTIKQSTIGTAFLAIFFIVSESAQNLFSETVGPYLGVAAAGVLVFAMAPLQDLAERVSSAAVPGAKPVERMSHDERAIIYCEQVRVVWEDGVLTKKDRRLLDTARDRLGLSVEEARTLEREVLAA